MTETIQLLSKKLSDDAIQRTKGTETKKGYDTTGYGYQYAVDKFNDVLGEDWGFNWKVVHEEQGKYRDKEYKQNDGTMKTVTGAQYWEITVDVGIWIKDKKPRSCVGGHTAITYADALKGAITNGFKKTAAFWGVGRDAFAGTIDDDNQPLPDSAENKVKKESQENDALAKLKSLPEPIKEGFKALGYNAKKVWEVCEMYSWNNDKIKEHLNLQAEVK